MLLAWVLPEASHGVVLKDGWTRAAYRPRHGRPPRVVRAGLSLAAVAGLARERYLGVREDEGLRGTPRPVS